MYLLLLVLVVILVSLLVVLVLLLLSHLCLLLFTWSVLVAIGVISGYFSLDLVVLLTYHYDGDGYHCFRAAEAAAVDGGGDGQYVDDLWAQYC